MKIQIPSPEQLSLFIPSKYHILVYGKPGTGKTLFGATWAELGDVLYIDTGDGLLSIVTSSFVQFKDRIYRVPVSNTSTDKHVVQPIGWLTIKQIADDLQTTGKYDNIAPKTVVLDESTTTSQYALNHVLYVNNHVGQQPTQPDWGKLRNEMIEFINKCRALPDINFIFICHEQYMSDELSGRTWCLPSVVGKLAYEIGGYFDEVYNTFTKELSLGKHEYLMHTKPTGMITAKSRFDLPTPVPTHYNSIKGSIEKIRSKVKANIGASNFTGVPNLKP